MEDLRAYFAAEVPLPDWAERAAVIDYLAGYERHLEAAEYFDEAHVRALVERIVDRTADMAASVMNHALAEEGEPARGRLDEIAAPALVIHGTAADSAEDRAPLALRRRDVGLRYQANVDGLVSACKNHQLYATHSARG